MFNVKVNEQKVFTIEGNTINQREESFDIIQIKDGELHVLWHQKSYTAVVVETNHEEKTAIIRVNGNDYAIHLQDKYDILLQQLGLGNLQTKKVNQIKAPMPGLVLRFEKKVGDEVKKGESVLILEAMKMENILKSPGDGKIKKFVVEQGQAVEKNQILVELE